MNEIIWITKGVPKKNGDYFVCLNTGDIFIMKFRKEYFEKGAPEDIYFYAYGLFFNKNEYIVAWANMIKPCKSKKRLKI